MDDNNDNNDDDIDDNCLGTLFGDMNDSLYDPFDESAPDQLSMSSEDTPTSPTPPSSSLGHTPPAPSSQTPATRVSTFCHPHPHPTPNPHPPQPSSRKTPDEKLADFLANGCGCKRKCSEYFDGEHYEEIRDSCSTLTREELDLVVLGQTWQTSMCLML